METEKKAAPGKIQNPLQPVFELMQGGDPELVCTKYGLTRSELEKLVVDYQKSRSQMALADGMPAKKVNRNEPCPCGSGKKYKKCCLSKHEEARRQLSPDLMRDMEERTRLQKQLEKDVEKGFDLIFFGDFPKAQRLAERLLEQFPEDDRLHDIMVAACMGLEDYDSAFYRCRQRWQVAQEEKDHYLEHGFHKRENDVKHLVHFYSPSTWIDKFWIAQRARTYRETFPKGDNAHLSDTANKLKQANDINRFPGRQEEGYEMRRKALAPVLEELQVAGPAAIPYLLPLTYQLSWASLFIPDLLQSYGTRDCIRLLAELSMYRFRYFSQKCLALLEGMGESAFPAIKEVMLENSAFDELKAGLIMVLGSIHTPESFRILARLTEHANPQVVSSAAQALEGHQNPEALPYIEKAKEHLQSISKIGGAIRDIAQSTEQASS